MLKLISSTAAFWLLLATGSAGAHFQVLLPESRGLFPVAAWWGFAALVTGEERLKSPESRQVAVELDGPLWVRAHEPNTRRSH